MSSENLGRLKVIDLPVNVCNGVPWKASMRRIMDPLVLMRIVLPSLENLSPVQSHSFSWLSKKVTKGPLSNDRRSYNLMDSELTPAAKISPSGSKADTGRPCRCITPWQFGERKSHILNVLSSDPEMKVSSIGEIFKDVTFFVWPGKYRKYLLSCKLRYRMVSSTFVELWIAVEFPCAKWIKSTPYFFELTVLVCVPFSQSYKTIWSSSLQLLAMCMEFAGKYLFRNWFNQRSRRLFHANSHELHV